MSFVINASFFGLFPLTNTTQENMNGNVGVELHCTQSYSNTQYDVSFNAHTSGTPTYYNLGKGPIVRFSMWKNTSDRLIRLRIGALSEFLTIPKVQYIANPSYYNHTTFSSSGDIHVVVDYIFEQTWDSPIGDAHPYYTILDENGIIYYAGQHDEMDFYIYNMPLKTLTMRITDVFNSFVEKTLVFNAGNTLSIISDIPKYNLSNNPIVLVSDSTLKFYEQTKYKHKLYNIDDELLVQSKVYPDPVSNYYGIYDVSMILNNYVTTDVVYDNIISELTNNLYEFKINVNDQVQTTGITSATKYVIKGSQDYDQDIDLTEYFDNYKFLTSWEGDFQLTPNQYLSVNYCNPIGLSEFANRIIVSNTAFTNQSTLSSIYQNSSKVGYLELIDGGGDYIMSAPCGTQNIINAHSQQRLFNYLDQIMSSNPIANKDTYYFALVRIEPAFHSIELLSDIKKVNVNSCETGAYAHTHFLYRDLLGNYNTFAFTNINIKEFDIDRSFVSSDYNTLIANKWTHNIGDRGLKNTNIKKTETHSVKSGWINDNISKNIIQLLCSTDVYIIKNGEKYPIVITNNSVIEKNIINDQLFNYTIQYKMAYNLNTNE